MNLTINKSLLHRFQAPNTLLVCIAAVVIGFWVLGSVALTLFSLDLHYFPQLTHIGLFFQEGLWPYFIVSLLFTGVLTVAAACVTKQGVIRLTGFGLFIALGGLLIACSTALMAFNVLYHTHYSVDPFHFMKLVLLLKSNHDARSMLMVLFLGTAALMASPLWVPYLTTPHHQERTHGSAKFAGILSLIKNKYLQTQGVVLGQYYGETVRVPGFESVLVTAPTGSGKTTAIAIPNLLEWDGSAIVNDLKGELYQKTSSYRESSLGNEVFRFAPADPSLNTHRYNPFAYVSSDPNLKIRDLQLIAEILIPAERVDGGFWYTSSREILVFSAIYLQEKNGVATLGDIYKFSTSEKFSHIISTEIATKGIKEAVFYQLAGSYMSIEDDKTKTNILKDFHARMSLFNDPMVCNATSGNDFDLSRLRKDKMSVYLCIPDSDKERLKHLITLMWAQTISLLSAKEPDIKDEPEPVLALLDEFGNMGRIPQLKAGLTYLRSYRVRAIVIVQYLGQILSAYGEKDARAFLNSKVKLAFALSDLNDAQYFSQILGSRAHKVVSSTESMGERRSLSTSKSYTAKPLLSVDALMRLPPQKLIAVVEGQNPFLLRKVYSYKNRIYEQKMKQ